MGVPPDTYNTAVPTESTIVPTAASARTTVPTAPTAVRTYLLLYRYLRAAVVYSYCCTYVLQKDLGDAKNASDERKKLKQTLM